MKDILFISPMAFHSKSNNAGAKILFYYIGRLSFHFNITVIILEQNETEIEKMVNEFPLISFIYDLNKKTLLSRFIDGVILSRLIYSFLKKIRPIYYRTNGLVKKRLNFLVNKFDFVKEAHIVIAEFPPLILQAEFLKNVWPKAKIIASIHDVSFQSMERNISNLSILGSRKKYLKSFRQLEIKKIKAFDEVVVLCQKDSVLLKNEGVSERKIHKITPYYDVYPLQQQNMDGLCFFGAMNRPENEKSVEWFIKNVWNVYYESTNLKLYIIGGGVSNHLKLCANESKNIIFTGYCIDPSSYFNKSFAMIVPLVLGAGIKIKSIEAMASGLPLLSNNIGIEGITECAGHDFLLCNYPEEWKRNIDIIISNPIIRNDLQANARHLIECNFNLTSSLKSYKELLDIIASEF